jgi:hypothetical protein
MSVTYLVLDTGFCWPLTLASLVAIGSDLSVVAAGVVASQPSGVEQLGRVVGPRLAHHVSLAGSTTLPEGVSRGRCRVGRNRYPGRCSRCGKTVPAGKGNVSGRPGAWQVTHIQCPTVAPSTRRPGGASPRQGSGASSARTRSRKFHPPWRVLAIMAAVVALFGWNWVTSDSPDSTKTRITSEWSFDESDGRLDSCDDGEPQRRWRLHLRPWARR